MHKHLLTFMFTLCCLVLQAQQPSKSTLAPCGSPTGIDPWLKHYTERPQDYTMPRSDDTLYVGLQVHLLAKDNGTGRFSNEKLLDAFCRLNGDFAPSGIRFYFKNPWDLIDSTGWYNHSTVPQGVDMMLANNYPDALNSYFVFDPAGNCGYSIPYGGVAIKHACANANGHTWAHEVGHTLSLPHPFIGWENKTYNFNTQTPDTLTYDYTYFHDSIETQVPAPLDTALVEYVDGSNCTVAADLFCDTKPDYLSYRWDCDGLNNSLAIQKDPDGVTFYSDGTLFMSYSSDECQNRFSDEQIAAMRANLLSEKFSWLSPGPPEADVTGIATPVSPINDQLTPSSGVILHWAAVPHATKYLLIGSRLSSFAVRDIDILTSDTMAVSGDLVANKKYYWHVRPFNDWSVCAPFSETATFMTAPVSGVSNPGTSGGRVYPTLLVPGDAIWLETDSNTQQDQSECYVFDASGRLLWRDNIVLHETNTLLNIPSDNWQPGVYQVLVKSRLHTITQRIVLIK